MNIVQTMRRETSAFADKTAIVEGSRSITYGQLLDRAAALSGILAARGVEPGWRMAFRCSDGIDYVIGALALLQCGAAVVPVADSLTHAEVIETIGRIDVDAIITHVEMPDLGDEEPGASLDDIFVWRTRNADPAMRQRCRDMGAAFIRFSSGTTGESKGVVLSHRAIVDRTDAANRGLAITQDDVILWVLSMSHHFVVSILLFLRKGATIIVANKSFPFSVLEAAQRYPITFIYGSPVHYYLLAVSDVVAKESLSRVRLAISTAMKMPPDVYTQFTAKFAIAPAEAYGIIEIGLPFINTEAGTAGRNTVGRMLADYQLQIANPDADGVGDVLIKGKGMFDAYFSPWRTAAECMHDGYFHTGDLGKLDEGGRLCLLGRSKTVIVCAGMKVFPEEVEEAINAMPGITESLVSGRPHPQYGQVPVAQVVLAAAVADPDTLLQDLRAHCLSRLSSYKVPAEFSVVNSLPKTPSGKLARAASVSDV